jgi:hypothetical protein
MRHPVVRSAWMGAAFVALMALSTRGGSAQTVIVNGAPAPKEKTEFVSPMILETVFAAADKSLWDSAKGYKPGEWFSTEEYHELGRFTCDGVSLKSSFNKKKETWDAGLEMSVVTGEQGQLRVNVRADVFNPDGNKDRKAQILFEVMNGDKVVGSSLGAHKVEEGDEKSITVHFSLNPTDLVTDPMTKLRMTIKVVRD